MKTNSSLSFYDVKDELRTVYETSSNFIEINQTLNNSNIYFILAVGKNNLTHDNGNKVTKIDVSMYVDNSVSNESIENYGMFSKYALASELKAFVKFDDKTVFENSLVAPNQNKFSENFYFEVIFK